MKVSDIITKDECRSWEPNDRIVIVAPTGTGKTHFVLNTLLEIARERNQTILYLCNRTLVMEQVWVSAKEKGVEFEYIDGLLYSNNIIITTYQNIESKGGFIYRENECRQEINFYYCVCDEAHYFVHDSVFNMNTGTVPTIINNYMNYEKKIIIYMTATDEPFRMQNSSNDIKYIFDDIGKKRQILSDIIENYEYNEEDNIWLSKDQRYFYYPERVKALEDSCKMPYCKIICSYLKNVSYNNQEYVYFNGFKWKVFNQIKPDYSQYEVYYYNQINELIELIKLTQNDKWLIFSMNKDEGKELAETINKHIEKDTAIFLDSKLVHSKDKNVLKDNKLSKRKNIYNEIRDNNKFSCRVLISTAVLDNGVSIHDSDLKHIVLPSHNKTEFLQMIGRKRLADNETAKLYIKNHMYREIINEQYSIIIRLNYILSFIKLNDIDLDIGTDDDNIYMKGRYNNKYPEQNINKILNYANKKYKTMFINSKLKYDSGKANDSDNSSKRLRDLKVNERFVDNMLCNLCEIAEISEYRMNNDEETPQYKYPVLFTQLSWLNKNYDATHWVDYERRELKTKEIIEVLKEDSQKGYFIEDKKKYISILTDAIAQSSISLHNMKKDVGVAAFNNILKKIGLNFKMDKKQFMKNGERKYRYGIKIVEK